MSSVDPIVALGRACPYTLGTDVVITQPMDGKLFKGLPIPRCLTDGVTRSGCRFKCTQQRIGLFGRWVQFPLGNQFRHTMLCIVHPYVVCNWVLGGRRSSATYTRRFPAGFFYDHQLEPTVLPLLYHRIINAQVHGSFEYNRSSISMLKIKIDWP